MYRLLALISVLIRQLCLPNPFETLPYGTMTNTMINIIIEPLLYKLTYCVVGLYYSKGSSPVFGSIIYLVFYVLHIGLIMLMGFFHWSIISISIIFILYIIFIIFIKVKSEGSFY